MPIRIRFKVKEFRVASFGFVEGPTYILYQYISSFGQYNILGRLVTSCWRAGVSSLEVKYERFRNGD